MTFGKNRLKFFYLLPFIFYFLPFVFFAQSTNFSPYSMQGIGDLETTAFASSMAMGGTKNAMAFPYSINIANPASCGFLQLPTFDAGFTSNFLSLSYTDSTKKIKNTYFKNMAFAFPVSKRWWASSFGLVPFSKTGYSIFSSGNVNNFGTVDYIYNGHGGIHRFFVGNAFNILKDSVHQFSIGANISYLFGTITKSKQAIPEAASLSYNTRVINAATVKDFYFDAGMIYSRKINNKWNFSLGAVYKFAKNLKSEKITLAESFTGYGSNENVKDTIALDTVKNGIFIPQKIGIGTTIYFNNRWLFAVDYSIQDWSKFKYFEENIIMAKLEEISAGVQYSYNAKERENFFKMLSYRAGFRYNKTPLVVKNQQLKEFGITFGVGIPVGEKSKGSFNLSVENGIRGENKNGLVGEQFTNIIFGFSFTPTFYDKWFAKPKID